MLQHRTSHHIQLATWACNRVVPRPTPVPLSSDTVCSHQPPLFTWSPGPQLAPRAPGAVVRSGWWLYLLINFSFNLRSLYVVSQVFLLLVQSYGNKINLISIFCLLNLNDIIFRVIFLDCCI